MNSGMTIRKIIKHNCFQRPEANALVTMMMQGVLGSPTQVFVDSIENIKSLDVYKHIKSVFFTLYRI